MSLKFVTGDEFLASQPDKMPWVIPPLCATGSSVMLYGRHKVGKSSAIVQLVHSLTTGDPWLGFPVMRTGNVIYLQLDMAKAEMWRVIKRAERCGYNMRKGLYLPSIAEGEQAVKFDIMDLGNRKELQDWCQELNPVAVIVDTINDAYSARKNDDINLFIREIVHGFREAIGDAVLIFLNHKRKEIQNKFAKKDASDDEPDQDGFLGGGGWAQVTSAIVELYKYKKTRESALILWDLRLDNFPGKIIKLKKTEHGFFENTMTSQQMLLYWPYCLSRDEQARVLETLKGQNDVFRDIAARTNTSFDAVKKQYQRAGDVEFMWRELLTEDDEGVET